MAAIIKAPYKPYTLTTHKSVVGGGGLLINTRKANILLDLTNEILAELFLIHLYLIMHKRRKPRCRFHLCACVCNDHASYGIYNYYSVVGRVSRLNLLMTT